MAPSRSSQPTKPTKALNLVTVRLRPVRTAPPTPEELAARRAAANATAEAAATRIEIGSDQDLDFRVRLRDARPPSEAEHHEIGLFFYWLKQHPDRIRHGFRKRYAERLASELVDQAILSSDFANYRRFRHWLHQQALERHQQHQAATSRATE